MFKEDRNEPQWVPVKVMSKSGGEYDARYLKACRSVKFARDGDGTPFFSVQYGRCRFPTPIALRTRSRLKQQKNKCKYSSTPKLKTLKAYTWGVLFSLIYHVLSPF